MTTQPTIQTSWRIAAFAFGVLALFSLAAAVFYFISDDFVIRGQVVPATDSRVTVWRVSLSAAAVLCAALAWLCHRQGRKQGVANLAA